MRVERELSTRMLLLAKWHEQQRDARPWLSGKGHAAAALHHDTAAADCRAAAQLINRVLEFMESTT